MTGRVNGKIAITDPKPYDSKRPVVYGATKTTYRNVKTTVYQGKNLRFRLIGARFQFRIQGRAIFLSAIARGDRRRRRRGRSHYERVLRRHLVAERLAAPVSARHSNPVRAGLTTGPAIAARSGILKGRCR